MIGPERVLMLTVAILLDTVGELLPGISEIIGVFFIGGWLLFRSQQRQAIKKPRVKNPATKLKTKAKKFKKWITPLYALGEFTPLTLLPFWTMLVWRELKR